ncbi:dynamin family protein [Leucobacter komagatae]|uniref:Dynamin family protein n=1 Tax=Leucobacter komagatae TaxID=55969 RepID=A0A542Y6V1_9MICO|nr:dynamin family protein [Leucobacter komagatae]TQL43727.1 dynamin family protein [Leucobacter komagatae]
MTQQRATAQELLAAAKQLYHLHADVYEQIEVLERRLDEPLRVALVGSVKAGKSTLLNGLLGERIAPTDSRECTRIVTWYHHGPTPRVRAHLTNGESAALPAKRQRERLELDLAGLSSDDVDRIDVTWPVPGIGRITLIDTPGIASASHDVSHETDRFLLPDEGAAGADAVIYLLRSLHESDVQYMRALTERTRHGNATIGSIAVLSRADELASGRLTAMVSINESAQRLRNSPELEGVCETVVPVAGLLGMGAMMLRQADFAAFATLAAVPSTETERLFISAERFITSRDQGLPAERVRIDLVDRFGMYGIRLAIALLRGGINDAPDLSAELLRRSGLEELRRVIDVHFTQRTAELKAHSVMLALHQLLRQRAVAGSEDLLLDVDQRMAASHTCTEMQLVGRIASGRLSLSDERAAELERLLGGRGSDPAVRLGLIDDRVHGKSGASGRYGVLGGGRPSTEQLLDEATKHLLRWRELLDNPLLDRETARACAVAEQSCERLILALMGHSRLAAA